MIDFWLGVVVASVVWFVLQRRQDARIDRDIEARLLALDRERVRRIFEKCELDGKQLDREHPALRHPDWEQASTRNVVDTEIRLVSRHDPDRPTEENYGAQDAPHERTEKP